MCVKASAHTTRSTDAATVGSTNRAERRRPVLDSRDGAVRDLGIVGLERALGTENLEERIDGIGEIDPVVLEELRSR